MAEVTRRSVLKMAGGAALGLGARRKILAIFEDGSIVVQDQRIPADKKLSPAWKKSLFERGTKEVWSGEELDSIGMPIGGIAAGQMYLCGDGTLGLWEVFNFHHFLSYGATNYAKRKIDKSVDFGLSINVRGKGERALSQEGFSDVSFEGTYPTAKISYKEAGFPVEVESVVYTPFIPLNARDSGHPATVFEITVHNTSGQEQAVDFRAHLENAVARSAEADPKGRRRHTRTINERDLTGFVHSADPAEDEFGQQPSNPRTAILIEDFEHETYGDWKVEGESFGPGPALGTLSNQNTVSGFVGRRLVNTYYKGDGTSGRLTSPEFTIQRNYINFKIGGGNHPGEECINLLVGGKVVRTATGLNDEALLWDAWNVGDLQGQTAKIEIVDKATGGWGHINIDHIEQADQLRSLDDVRKRRGDANRDNGTLALGVLSSGNALGDGTYTFFNPHVAEIVTDPWQLGPGDKKTFVAILAWHFPNHARGHQYSNWYVDAEAVMRSIIQNYDRLSNDTHLWVKTYYDSTLPYWLLDRLMSTNGNLSTGTTEWWSNGRFWSWEGVVCCAGTCTHVWNYEHGMARLFPELERNVRVRQDFGEGFDPATGLVGFRSNRAYAADGQCGTILKAYREHLTSADDSFLKQNWPRIKMAMQFLIGHDANGDGLIEDGQPNTFDIDFFGANTFVGSLYLGALRAAEEMAKEVGDTEFAAQCRDIFTKGSDKSVQLLWNGEYFIQDVDETVHDRFQYGPGCLSDQLFGQGWAHQVGLGHIYPEENVKTGLKSVWKYNFAPDVAPYNARWAPERPFAVPGEAGLFICTWPKGGREDEPVRYRDEVWTGIEYQVAGNMVWDGLVEEGLAICRAVHDRYQPIKRNPYNEVECSDHYARALASWGVYTALSGFSYHGPAGRIGFAPRVSPSAFRAAFTAAEGWGTFDQRISGLKQTSSVAVVWGRLRVGEISLASSFAGDAIVTFAGRPVGSTTRRDGERVVVSLTQPMVLGAGDMLKVEIG